MVYGLKKETFQWQAKLRKHRMRDLSVIAERKRASAAATLVSISRCSLPDG